MKSIMEEASSISKAIEKGWVKAGQPKEFSVKIFEEPKKNFFGLTTKSAKIGIFFGETKPEVQLKQKRETRSAQQQAPRLHREQVKKEYPTKHQDIKRDNFAEKQALNSEEKTSIWTDSMIEDVQAWLKNSLNLGGVKIPEYTAENHMFHLKISFNNPLLDDQLKEKYLFSSISLLLLQMLKQKYKRPLKGYKIILSS